MRLSFLKLALLAGFSTAISSAAILNFYTTLAPEALGATGSGSATVRFDTIAQTLAINTTWQGLSGTTTVAHIHCCTASAGSGTIGVAVTPGTLPSFPVGVNGGTYAIVLDLTQTGTYTSGFLGVQTAAQASASLLQGIVDGKAYLNIHSNIFPAGEIRGFLQPVPEPSTMALAGLALGLVVLGARKAQIR